MRHRSHDFWQWGKSKDWNIGIMEFISLRKTPWEFYGGMVKIMIV